MLLLLLTYRFGLNVETSKTKRYKTARVSHENRTYTEEVCVVHVTGRPIADGNSKQ